MNEGLALQEFNRDALRRNMTQDFIPFGRQDVVLRDRYDCMALVSVPKHTEGLDLGDSAQIVVCHGWLMWQELSAKNIHSAHYECMADQRDIEAVERTAFVSINDWMFEGDKDPTEFRGLSLARMFAKELQVLQMERRRLSTALTEMLDRFSPSRILYYDFRAEHSVLAPTDRLSIVVEIASRRGIEVVDRSDPPRGDDADLPFAEFYGRHEQADPDLQSAKRIASRIVSAALGAMGGVVRGLFVTRPAVFLATTHLTSLPLLKAFAGKETFALVLSQWYPRKRDLSFVFRNLLKGILPVAFSPVALSAEDRADVAAIIERLHVLWRDEPSGDRRDCHQYFLRYVAESGRIFDMVSEFKGVERLLRRQSPSLVLTDGVDYYLCVMFLLVAQKMGIATAATWHAPFVQDVNLVLLGCDPRMASAADWFFSWSDVNDRWLDNIGAKANRIRTGNPVARRSAHTIRIGTLSDKKRVLLLQYAGTGEDFVFPQARQFEFFVAAVRGLNALGAIEVRLKLHPGPYNTAYYRKIAERYGLDVEIYKDEPFGDLVGWADVVVGPAASGAMLEVVGAGKPYLPVLLQPSLVNPDYFRNLPLCSSAEAVVLAIKTERYADLKQIERDFSGIEGDAGLPAARMWDAIDAICLDQKTTATER